MLKRIAFVLLCLPALAAGQSGPLVPRVEVYGTSASQIAPDILRWRVSLENVGPDIASVAQEHARLTAATIKFLRDRGVAERDLQTSRMSLEENWEYQDRKKEMKGYKASTAVAFSSSDLGAYQDLWLGLSEIKGVSVDSAQWDTSKRIDLQNSTRRDALSAARTKAADMAAALGGRIGRPITIEEVQSYSDDDGYGAGNPASNSIVVVGSGSDAGVSDSLAPGALTVRVRVKVTFKLEE